ncbi:hypothetical protein T459_17096 [Capsicum annuum]|uniref:Uncharacterized protein n=1 Tax=Capsicum annuum TaxID=4072 RepID=A0A2G2ZAS4_CAPAN|nr:hypothetical protein T459_17096 [Capsicum annuum]
MQLQVHYIWPLNSNINREFEDIWNKISKQAGGGIISHTIPVMFGRTLEVPESCNGVARFTFEYLCGRPLGAADYIAVAKNYHTVFISDIPIMSMRIRDKVPSSTFLTTYAKIKQIKLCFADSAACMFIACLLLKL